jgi:hypothetical protein
MRRKRKSRATNKLQGSQENALIPSVPEPVTDAPPAEVRTTTVVARRSSLFTAELEEVIALIARERVYRAMLAGMGRRLLAPPPDL